MSIVFEVYNPRNKGALVRRRPCIGKKMKATWMLLHEFLDLFLTHRESGLDIASNGRGRGNGYMRPTSSYEFDQVTILDDLYWTSILDNPLDNVCTSLRIGERAVGHGDRLLPLSREGLEDGSVGGALKRLAGEGSFDGVFPKATLGMMFEIGS
jgi:hypothetical protein